MALGAWLLLFQSSASAPIVAAPCPSLTSTIGTMPMLRARVEVPTLAANIGGVPTLNARIKC